MRKVKISFLFSISLALSLVSRDALAQANPIDSLQPGHWYMVPNSRMDAVDPCPLRNCSYSGVEGFSAIMDDWNGGAYDTKRDRLIVWGGGHGGYAGNEFYAFDINTLKWLRLNNPSTPFPFNTIPNPNTNPDGTPVSVHSTDAIEYLPNVDRFWSYGGSRWYDGLQHELNWLFNFDTLTWTRKSNSPASYCGSFEDVSAYDPVTGTVFIAGPFSCRLLHQYNPVTDVWTQRGGENTFVGSGKNAAMDTKRRKMVVIGLGEANVFNITTTGTITKQTIAAGPCGGSNSPGIAYDPVSDRIVVWRGGANVCTLNLDTLTWTQVSPAPTNTVTPTSANVNGTYGRFQYIPSKNAFIAVNRTNENVYIYKLSSGAGTPPPPTTPPAAPTNLGLR